MSLVYRTALIVIIICFAFPVKTQAGTAVELPDIESKNLSVIRNDIKAGLSVVKNSKNPGLLPALTFYSYKLKKGDTFWKVLSRTSLNIDTVMSVNNLSSPEAVKEGDILYFPNMRGVLTETRGFTLESMASTFKIRKEYITAVNGASLKKPYFFVPCGEVTSLERSLFLGTGFAAPLETLRRTSNFGARRDPISGEKAFHSGVDLGCRVNTPVFAARTGKVIYSGYEGDYGQLVVIEHTHGYYSYYGHLSRIRVKKGDKVSATTCIALSGNTGRTTGPHLHFEIRKNSKPVNPVIVLR